MRTVINLQRRCAELGFTLVNEYSACKELENMLRKALGILRENGIYSFFLWLEEKGAGNVERDETKVSEKILARGIFSRCFLLVDDLGFSDSFEVNDMADLAKSRKADLYQSSDWANIVAHYTKIFIMKDYFLPDDLFMLSELYSQLLTYSLYKAKAGGKNG